MNIRRQRIIGIDPGSRITGYGIVEAEKNSLHHIDCGGIHVPEKKSVGWRLNFIYDKLISILEQTKPDHACVEDVFFAKNVKSALLLGQARGIILLALTRLDVPFTTYSTREVKKAVTGYGSATKEQIQYMVQKLLKLPEAAFEDASDALALAICHCNHVDRRVPVHSAVIPALARRLFGGKAGIP